MHAILSIVCVGKYPMLYCPAPLKDLFIPCLSYCGKREECYRLWYFGVHRFEEKKKQQGLMAPTSAVWSFLENR
jgi:hypothetical protein